MWRKSSREAIRAHSSVYQSSDVASSTSPFRRSNRTYRHWSVEKYDIRRFRARAHRTAVSQKTCCARVKGYHRNPLTASQEKCTLRFHLWDDSEELLCASYDNGVVVGLVLSLPPVLRHNDNGVPISTEVSGIYVFFHPAIGNTMDPSRTFHTVEHAGTLLHRRMGHDNPSAVSIAWHNNSDQHRYPFTRRFQQVGVKCATFPTVAK